MSETNEGPQGEANDPPGQEPVPGPGTTGGAGDAEQQAPAGNASADEPKPDERAGAGGQANDVGDIHADRVNFNNAEHITQVFGEQATLLTFTCGGATWAVYEREEHESALLYGGSDAEAESLLTHLVERRVLVLAAEEGAHATTAATYLGYQLRQRRICTGETLAVNRLDRHMRVDVHQLTHKDDAFTDRVLIFRNAFGRGNRELARLFERTDRAGWGQLADRLRERNAFLVFTTTEADLATVCDPPALAGLHCELEPPPRERLAAALERRLESFTARSDVTPEAVDTLRSHAEPLLARFRFMAQLAAFLEFFVLHQPALEVSAALVRFSDTGEWLRHDGDGDLEGWSFGFTLALAQCAPDANGVAWVDFDRLHRQVRQWLLREMRPLAAVPVRGGGREGAEARLELSDEALHQRCQAEVEKDPVSLADMIRFRNGASPQGLWRLLLQRHRRVLTAILPRLRELAERSDDEAEARSLRALAAEILGRIGEMDPRRIVEPLIERWVESGDRRQQAVLGPLFQGVMGSGSECYRAACLRYLQKLQDTASPDDDDAPAEEERETEPAAPPASHDGARSHEAVRPLRARQGEKLVAVMAAYTSVGDHDLELAMRQLGRIARTHLVPMIEDTQRLQRLLSAVERSFEERQSVSEAVILLSYHERLSDLVSRIYAQQGGTLIALQFALASLCMNAGPAQVFREMRRWITDGGWKMGVLAALILLHDHGLAATLARSRGGGGASRARNPVVLSIARGEDELVQTVRFMGDLVESVSRSWSVDSELKKYCVESLLEHLTTWARDSVHDATHRAAMLRLFEALAKVHGGILHDPIVRLLGRGEFTRDTPELRTFAADLHL
jgi:hypothetical protein